MSVIPQLPYDVLCEIFALSLHENPTVPILEVACNYPHSLTNFVVDNIRVREKDSKLFINLNGGEYSEYTLAMFSEMVSRLEPYLQEATFIELVRINATGSSTPQKHPVANLLQCMSSLVEIEMHECVINSALLDSVFARNRESLDFQRCVSTVFTPAAVEKPLVSITELAFTDCGLWLMNDVMRWANNAKVQMERVEIWKLHHLRVEIEDPLAHGSLLERLMESERSWFEEEKKSRRTRSPLFRSRSLWAKLFSECHANGEICLTLSCEDKFELASDIMIALMGSPFQEQAKRDSMLTRRGYSGKCDVNILPKRVW